MTKKTSENHRLWHLSHQSPVFVCGGGGKDDKLLDFCLSILSANWSVLKNGGRSKILEDADKVLEDTPTYWSAWSMWESNDPNQMNPKV